MSRRFGNESRRDPRRKDVPPIGDKILNLANKTQFDKDFPVFTLPKFVGSFSLDINRAYHHDLSQLRYLYLPSSQHPDGSWKVDFDLRKGAVGVIEKDEESVRLKMLDDLLKWILKERAGDNWSIFSHDPSKLYKPLEIEFVCFRGLLTMIMASPYEYQEGWSIVATKLHSTIYLWHLKESKGNNEINPKNSRLHEMSVWGFKFEQYLCTNSLNSTPDPEEQLNTNAEFCCVVKSRLAGHALLYGAEVDALKPEAQPPWEIAKNPNSVPSLKGFVELKTNRHIETERQDATFRKFKLMKWWAQSFIVGVPTIICGYRDDDGVVTELEEFSVDKICKMGEKFWLPRILMNFGQQFLEFVSSCFDSGSSAHPTAHYIFDFDAQSRKISARQVEDRDLPRPLLPVWYVEEMQRPC